MTDFFRRNRTALTLTLGFVCIWLAAVFSDTGHDAYALASGVSSGLFFMIGFISCMLGDEL